MTPTDIPDGWYVHENIAMRVCNGVVLDDDREEFELVGNTWQPAVVLTKAEYDALVAAAQDAEYEPVPNGTYNNIAVADNRLYLRMDYKTATVYLPETWRLMRPRKQAD